MAHFIGVDEVTGEPMSKGMDAVARCCQATDCCRTDSDKDEDKEVDLIGSKDGNSEGIRNMPIVTKTIAPAACQESR